jgi:hypothetical protein
MTKRWLDWERKLNGTRMTINDQGTGHTIANKCALNFRLNFNFGSIALIFTSYIQQIVKYPTFVTIKVAGFKSANNKVLFCG